MSVRIHVGCLELPHLVLMALENHLWQRETAHELHAHHELFQIRNVRHGAPSTPTKHSERPAMESNGP